jgi:GIY-YIG catalytic domain
VQRFAIYCLTNRVNGKQYVGQTGLTVAERMRYHRQHAVEGRGPPVLSSAIRKYGFDAFDVEGWETRRKSAWNTPEKRAERIENIRASKRRSRE